MSFLVANATGVPPIWVQGQLASSLDKLIQPN